MIVAQAAVQLLFVPGRLVFADNHPQTALEIFDKALARFKADRTALRKWQYEQTLTAEQFDRKGKVTARGQWHALVRPGAPEPVHYTSSKVTGNLSFFEPPTDEPNPDSPSLPATKSSPTPAEQKKAQADEALTTTQKYHLRERYLWKRKGIENAVGESAFVLSFTPKPHQNAGNREEQFFAQMAGTFWVSRRDYSLLKAEVALQSPVNLFWVIARVTKFHLTYQVEPAFGFNRFLRKSKALAETVVAFPFVSIHQQHQLAIDKFAPRAGAARDSSN